ncbi:hypothetical protein TEA_016613 [Camellia sinensis var. sinensis]|uniref:PPM-type phosphatase domain-containing protein n=1 Tax=Camellia sinensis var. sinensis TaxID=542762 RepID=A0A4S4DUD4_CAMSN|nr:hypothetical protein TEA_016613 [Camellia sinensis var. sinensis]
MFFRFDVSQGDLIVIANIGDSRAVLATISDDVCLVPLQLTVDLKPNLPQETERIRESKGRVFAMLDEPSVDRFVILATDGVWDVLSNREVVEVGSSTPEREESANRLVQHAVCAWKRKKPGMAVDDISAICLFFHNSTSSQTVDTIKLP